MTILPDNYNDRKFDVLFDDEQELIVFEDITLNKSVTFFQFSREGRKTTWITCIIRDGYYLEDCINEINKLKL